MGEESKVRVKTMPSIVILDLIQNLGGTRRSVIPRGSGNPGGGATMPSIVILDLIQNLGGDTAVRHSPRKRESTGRGNDA